MINKLKQLVKNLSVNGVLSQVSELTDRTVRFARKNTMHFIGRSIVIVVVIAGVLLFTLQDAGLYAANANITPDTDITTDFLQQTGCTATTHYNCVNDGSDSTFVNTGDTNGGDGEVEEYGLETVSAVDSASQIDVVVRARRIATGSDPDNLLINLRISGSLQTAATRTPGTTWGDLATATFTGTWTQADIDGAQIQITRATGWRKPEQPR